MNTAAKGSRIEREFEKKLNDAGYITHRTMRTAFKANDIFGLFDIVAKHTKNPDTTYYFQISTRWKSGAERKAIEAFPRGVNDRVFMVRKKNNKSFELKIFCDDGWK